MQVLTRRSRTIKKASTTLVDASVNLEFVFANVMEMARKTILKAVVTYGIEHLTAEDMRMLFPRMPAELLVKVIEALVKEDFLCRPDSKDVSEPKVTESEQKP